MSNNERYSQYNMNFNTNSNNLGMGFRVGGGGGGGTGPMATGGEPTTSMVGGTGGGAHHTTMTEPQQAAAAAGNYGNQVNNGSHGGVRSSGMLPPSLLQKIDELIDRLNASSGHAVKNSNPSDNTNTNTNNNNNNNSQPPPIRIICIGTNEGIPLSRSYGTPSTSNNLSEEMLSSLETFWNTVPSSVAPNVMTSSIAHQHQQQQLQQQQHQQQQQSNDTKHKDKTLPSYQPPHPLLHHIGMGPILKSTTIYYENCVYIQYHLSPLVITIITSPQITNIGYIKSFALPILKELLEPIRLLVLKRRIDLSLVLSSAGNGGGGSGHGHGNGRVIAGSGGNGSGGHHNIVGLSITGDASGNGSAGSGLHSYGNGGFL